jgi:hypothetical protein
MAWMIGDTKFQADDGGDSTAGPQFSAKAVGGGALMQQGGQAGQLLGRQPPRGPRWRSAPERLGAGFPGPLHPLTDRALADPHGHSNLALRPTLLLEVPGLQAPGFLPGVRCRVHAS